MEHIADILTVMTLVITTIVAALSSPRRVASLESENRSLKIRVQKQERTIVSLENQIKRLEAAYDQIGDRYREEEEFPF